MRTKLVFILLFLGFLNIHAQTETKIKCNRYLKNNYKESSIHKFSSINEKDTLTINVARYECVYSTFYLDKVMFDKYGKWDNFYRLKSPNQIVLTWNNIKLFEDSDVEYLVATSGLEDGVSMYTSVFVFDENNNDMFSEASPKRDFLLNYFGEMIRNNKSRKKDFYDVFWKEADIEKWKMLYGKSNK